MQSADCLHLIKYRDHQPADVNAVWTFEIHRRPGYCWATQQILASREGHISFQSVLIVVTSARYLIPHKAVRFYVVTKHPVVTCNEVLQNGCPRKAHCWLEDSGGSRLNRNVGNYQSARRQIPYDCNLHQHRCDNLKSHCALLLFCESEEVENFRSVWNDSCTYYYCYYYYLRRDSAVSILTRYGLDGPGIESRRGARFSAPVQTGPGAHPASYTMGTGSLQGVKRPGRGVDHPPPI